MNKKLLIAIIVILLLIGGGFAYLLSSDEPQQELDTMKSSQDSTDQTMDKEALKTEEPAAEVKDTTGSSNTSTQPSETTKPVAGTYQSYSADAVAKSSATDLLFFHAAWCPQCRQLDGDIKAKGAPDGVAIFKVDYDSNQALRKQYGVTLQTTVVRVDANGNFVEKFVAYDSPTLQAIKDALL